MMVSLPLIGQTILIQESFDYADGPLQGKGEWSRGVTSPSADNPSDYLIVANGALRYDWTTTDPINNALRWQWEEALYEGWVYAEFTLNVSQAPSADNVDARPTIVHFDRSGGSQMRAHVGIRAGPETGTFQLGISPSSQSFGDSLFAEDVLVENTPYTVRVGYDIGTSETWLWINPTGDNPAPVITGSGSPGTNVRRIQLKMRNGDDSPDGVSNLGIFTMDDLTVYADDPPGSGTEPQEPIEIYTTDTFAYSENTELGTHGVWQITNGTPQVQIRQNIAYPFDSSAVTSGVLTRTLNALPQSTVAYAVTLNPPAVTIPVSTTNIIGFSNKAGNEQYAILALESSDSNWRLGLRSTPTGAVTWTDAAVPSGSSSRWVVALDTQTGGIHLYDDTNTLTVDPVATLQGTAAVPVSVALFSMGNSGLKGLGLTDLHVTSSRASALETPIDIVTPPEPEKFLLFLLAGQSNMAGRGDIAAEDLIGNRRIVFFNEDRNWQVARDPLHWDRPGYNGVGPALSFARDILEELPEDVSIGLIPTAQGGTSISWWQKSYSGSNLYYGGQKLFDHAVSRAMEASQNGVLTAILWNQGENDAGSAEGDNGASYRTLLHALINDFRADFSDTDLPFIAATLGPWRTNAAALDAVYLSLPSEVENTAVVNTRDPAVVDALVNNPNDTPHYMSYSYRLLGTLYADAFRPFLPQPGEPLPWTEEGLEVGQSGNSPWFGQFTLSTEGWLNHQFLGWVNINAVSEKANLWLYSLVRGNWVWSSDLFFPILYDFLSNDWIYYAHYPEYGTHIYSYGSDTWTWELIGGE